MLKDYMNHCSLETSSDVSMSDECVGGQHEASLQILMERMKAFKTPYEVLNLLNRELPKFKYLYAKALVDAGDELCDFYGGICEVVEELNNDIDQCLEFALNNEAGTDECLEVGDEDVSFVRFNKYEVFTGYQVIENIEVIEYKDVWRTAIRTELEGFLEILDLFEEGSEAVTFHFDLYWSMVVERLDMKSYELFKSDVIEILEDTPVVDYVKEYVFVNEEIDDEECDMEDEKDFLKKLKRFTNKNIVSNDMCKLLENLGFENKSSKADSLLYVNSDVCEYAVTFKLHGDFHMYTALQKAWSDIVDFYSVSELREAFVNAGFKFKF
jgi:hypothetical protein